MVPPSRTRPARDGFPNPINDSLEILAFSHGMISATPHRMVNTAATNSSSPAIPHTSINTPPSPMSFEELQRLSGPEFLAIRPQIPVILGRATIPAELDPVRIAANLRYLDPFVQRAAAHHKIDAALIHAVMINESGGRLDAMSGTGAFGPMQLTRWIYASREFSSPINPFDPADAVDRAAAYLAGLRDQFGGDLEKILAAYNQGAPAVARAVSMAAERGGRWQDFFFAGGTNPNASSLRSEGLRFIQSVKAILNGSDRRAAESGSFLTGGAEMATNGRVPSATEWENRLQTNSLQNRHRPRENAHVLRS